MQMDQEGWLDLSVISSFNRIKCFSSDLELLKEAVNQSEIVEAKDGKIRRKEGWQMWVFTPEIKASIQEKRAERLAQPSREDGKESEETKKTCEMEEKLKNLEIDSNGNSNHEEW